MTLQTKDFLELRTLIIRNKVLNALLTAAMFTPNRPVFIGTSLIKLEGALRAYEKERKGPNARLPRYVMANIVVSLGTTFSVGYLYNSSPIIWVKQVNRTGDTYIAALKNFTKIICETFSLNAAKSDKIFSRIPHSLTILLESQNISVNFWRIGSHKKISNVSPKFVDEAELKNYYKNLRSRLNDWRCFNLLLINRLKKGDFELDKPNVGKLTLSTTPLNNRLYISLASYTDDSRLSAIIPYDSLNPVDWERCNCEIDIFTLRKLFSTHD